MKVVINKCYGGFGLSPEAALWLYEKGYKGDDFVCPVEEYFGKDGIEKNDDKSLLGYKSAMDKWEDYLKTGFQGLFLTVFSPCKKFVISTRIEREDRHNPLVVECVETLGSDAASGRFANLEVVEIPDGVEYTIEEYDGNEHIAEKHRTWG